MGTTNAMKANVAVVKVIFAIGYSEEIAAPLFWFLILDMCQAMLLMEQTNWMSYLESRKRRKNSPFLLTFVVLARGLDCDGRAKASVAHIFSFLFFSFSFFVFFIFFFLRQPLVHVFLLALYCVLPSLSLSLFFYAYVSISDFPSLLPICFLTCEKKEE